MSTRQDFVNFINTIPGASEALGDDLTKWLNGKIYGIEDRWFALFQQPGCDEWSLKNSILFYLNLPSLYSDYSNKKKVLGDQYRTYLAIAKQVLQQSQDQLAFMKKQMLANKDPDGAKIWQVQIDVQNSTIISQNANVQT